MGGKIAPRGQVVFLSQGGTGGSHVQLLIRHRRVRLELLQGDASDLQIVISASSVDVELLGLLTQACLEGEVHSVFTRAANMSLDAGQDRPELLTLTTPNRLNAPNRILVSLPGGSGFPRIGLSSGMKVRVSSETLEIPEASFRLNLKGARLWHSPEGRAVSPEKLIANLPILSRTLIEARRGDSEYRGSPGKGGEILGRLLADRTRDSLRGLIAGLLAFDPSQVQKHTGELVGLGDGLTPAGDDLLLGLFAALERSHAGWGSRRREILAIALRSSLEKTNWLSARILEFALETRFPEIVEDLIAAVVSGSQDLTRQAAGRILRIGATSGWYLCLGIFLGLSLALSTWKRRRRTEYSLGEGRENGSS